MPPAFSVMLVGGLIGRLRRLEAFQLDSPFRVDEFLGQPFPALAHQQFREQPTDCRSFLLFAGHPADFLDLRIGKLDCDFHTPGLQK